MTITNSKIKLNMDALKSSKEWVRHKVKSGNNIYRILPPFGESSNGYPYRKWQIIWGMSDPENGRVRPYASSMQTEKRDPVVEFLEPLKERLAKMEGDLKARGLDDKAVNKHPKYARLAKFIRDVSPKTVYIYNAVDKSGVIGLLELKSTAHKDMKSRMNQYIQDYNQDPTSLNSADDDSGVWFNVVRTGEGFSTEYKVEKVQVKTKLPTGQISFVDDRSPLPETVVQNFDSMAYDLSAVYKTNTYDEINEVLQANLDKFYEVCPEANLTVEVNLDSEEDDVPVAVAKTPVTQVVPKTVATKPVALKLDDEDDAAPAPAAATAKAAPVVAAAPAAEEDDFMAQADAILNS